MGSIYFKWNNGSGNVYQTPYMNWSGSGKYLKAVIKGYSGYKAEVWGIGKKIADVIGETDITSDPFELNIPYNDIDLGLDHDGAVDIFVSIRDATTGELVDQRSITIFTESSSVSPWDLESVIQDLGLDKNWYEGKIADIVVIDVDRGRAVYIEDYLISWELPKEYIQFNNCRELVIAVVKKGIDKGKLEIPRLLVLYLDQLNNVKRLIVEKDGIEFGLRFAVKYNDTATLLNILSSLAGNNYFIIEKILNNPNLTESEKAKLLIPFAHWSITQELSTKVYYMDVDTATNTLYIGVRAKVGDPDIDWSRVGLLIAGVVLIALGVFTFGATSVVGAGLIGAGVGVIAVDLIDWYIYSNYPTDINDIKENVKSKITNIQVETANKFDELLALVEQLYQQGKIDQDTYSVLKSKIQDTKEYVNAKLKDLKDEMIASLDEAYKRGYKKGYDKARDDMKIWLAVSGIGGFAVGYILGRK